MNGRVAKLGERAIPGVDKILLDGEPIPDRAPLTYVVLHKPPGVLSSSRSQAGHPTVLDLIDAETRLYPVGRLDFDSEGLMLLTNDGALTHELTHPSYQHEKEYRVLLDRPPTGAQLRRWRQGVRLADGRLTAPCEVWLEGDRDDAPWIRVVLCEGRNRQIRESAAVLGLRVRRVIRVRIAGLELGDLEPGEWRELDGKEMRRRIGGAEESLRNRTAERGVNDRTLSRRGGG